MLVDWHLQPQISVVAFLVDIDGDTYIMEIIEYLHPKKTERGRLTILHSQLLKITMFNGKSTISMAIFNSKLFLYQRLPLPIPGLALEGPWHSVAAAASGVPWRVGGAASWRHAAVHWCHFFRHPVPKDETSTYNDPLLCMSNKYIYKSIHIIIYYIYICVCHSHTSSSIIYYLNWMLLLNHSSALQFSRCHRSRSRFSAPSKSRFLGDELHQVIGGNPMTRCPKYSRNKGEVDPCLVFSKMIFWDDVPWFLGFSPWMTKEIGMIFQKWNCFGIMCPIVCWTSVLFSQAN